jgi:hypothetical protein
MKLLDAHRSVLTYLGVATLIALAGLLAGVAWICDLLIALTAIITALQVFARLTLEDARGFARVVGIVALLILIVVAVAALTQVFGVGAFGAGRVPDAAHLPILIVLELCLLGAILHLAAARRDVIARHRDPRHIGDFARHLFATSGLFKKVRHPRIGNFTLPGHKPVFMIGRFLHWFPRIAPQVRARHGIGVWQQFCDLLVMGARHGLDAQVYYMFELYRPEQRGRAAGYLTRYEMKNGLYKVLTWQVAKSQRRIMLGDKLGMYRICQEHNIPTAPVLAVADGGKLDFQDNTPADLRQDLFLKPRHAKGSRGTEVVRYADGRYVTEDGTRLDYDGLVALIAARAKDESFLVQPRIRNHPGLADLADRALMRIRTVTCQDATGKPVLTHAVLSNLCKLETGWPTDIELGSMIDIETGALGPMSGDKAEMWLDWHENHPVTKARVLGRIVPCWEQAKQISVAAHEACSDRALIGWDIAIGTMGAVLLEGNSYPDVDFLQRAHQRPAGESILGPILFARLADIEVRSAAGTLRGPMDYEPATGLDAKD